MGNQIIDKITKPSKKTHGQKASQKFILALISSIIPIVVTIIYKVNYGKIEMTLGNTLLLIWIFSNLWISIISFWGVINGIISFTKKEKNSTKNGITLFGNIILFCGSTFFITTTFLFLTSFMAS